MLLPQIFGRWFLALVLCINFLFVCGFDNSTFLYDVKTSMTYVVTWSLHCNWLHAIEV